MKKGNVIVGQKVFHKKIYSWGQGEVLGWYTWGEDAQAFAKERHVTLKDRVRVQWEGYPNEVLCSIDELRLSPNWRGICMVTWELQQLGYTVRLEGARLIISASPPTVPQ